MLCQKKVIRIPSVHVGCTSAEGHHDLESLSRDLLHLDLVSPGDILITKNPPDKAYIQYWKNLMSFNPIIFSPKKEKENEHLIPSILKDKKLIRKLKVITKSKSLLKVFNPGLFEEKLAQRLGMTLYGSRKIFNKYGTKLGVRQLAKKCEIPVIRAEVFENFERAMIKVRSELQQKHKIIIKKNFAAGGEGNLLLANRQILNPSLRTKKLIDKFKKVDDKFLVEEWIQEARSISSMFEILPSRKILFYSPWWQIIDPLSRVAYRGAVWPAKLSIKIIKILNQALQRMADLLVKEGAIGYYNPDFIYKNDKLYLVELNSRIAVTFFSMAIVDRLLGEIRGAFKLKHYFLRRPIPFSTLKDILQEDLFPMKGKEQGLVIHNVNFLPWNQFFITAIAQGVKEAKEITRLADLKLFENGLLEAFCLKY